MSQNLQDVRATLQTISRAIKISSISKYIERIADHATNIAELVVFMVKGNERPAYQ
ncbi:MAG: hypothetical protein FJ145_14635 [Deltaproteobacteria bacterium]|nr:hypothetical protein [Deltaproteobacteria bacterium]